METRESLMLTRFDMTLIKTEFNQMPRTDWMEKRNLSGKINLHVFLGVNYL